MGNIVGSFNLKTFGGKVYKFECLNNGLMYCKDITMYPLYRIVLKPLFDLYGLNEYGNKVSIFIPRNKANDYIESVDIDNDLLNYMRMRNMIMYSTDMAYLYNLPSKDGYDRLYQKRAFKHVKDKSKVLMKQRRGYYN